MKSIRWAALVVESLARQTDLSITVLYRITMRESLEADACDQSDVSQFIGCLFGGLSNCMTLQAIGSVCGGKASVCSV
jgi:hypothetical protein